MSKTEGLSKVQLRKKLDEFYSHPLINIYLAMRIQVDKISKQIEVAHIDFADEDSILFKNFLAFSDKSPKIAEALESMRQKIDPDELKKAQAEKLKANELSPEAFALKRKNQPQNDR